MIPELPSGDYDDIGEMAGRLGLSYDDESFNDLESWRPTRNLLISMVAKAVSEYLRYKGSDNLRLRLLHKRAEYWLFYTVTNGGGRPRVGSFAWVCELLEEDPDAARARIQGMSIDDMPKVDHFSRSRKPRRPR